MIQAWRKLVNDPEVGLVAVGIGYGVVVGFALGAMAGMAWVTGWPWNL